MNILVLSPYPPYPPHGGGTMRIYQLLRGLSRRHTVTCLTFAPNTAAEHALAPLQRICRVIPVPGPHPRSMAQRAWTTLTSALPDMALRNADVRYRVALRGLLATEHFDVIQAESIEMAAYLPEQAAHSARNAGSTLILDQFNAEYLIQKRAFWADARTPRRWHAAAYSLVQWRKLLRYEAQVMRRCNAVLAVSEDDCQTLARLVPGMTIGLVPNGVDTTSFSRTALAATREGMLVFGAPTLVFSGTLDYRPNVDALVWFASEVLPLLRTHYPNLRLLAVGKRPAPAVQQLARDGLLVLTGEVADARPFIAGASVYVVPMRIGGGVRLKLLEALALEAPVVSTHMGGEGVIGLQHGTHCLLADRPNDFAAAVLQLLDDPLLGRQLAAAGRALVAAHYDWEMIIPRIEACYERR